MSESAEVLEHIDGAHQRRDYRPSNKFETIPNAKARAYGAGLTCNNVFMRTRKAAKERKSRAGCCLGIGPSGSSVLMCASLAGISRMRSRCDTGHSLREEGFPVTCARSLYASRRWCSRLTSTGAAGLTGKLDLSPRSKTSPARDWDLEVCVTSGVSRRHRTVAALSYQRRQHFINLLTWPSSVLFFKRTTEVKAEWTTTHLN